MIHHISIPAENPRQVVEVLARLLNGRITGFGPYGNSFIAWAGDEVGTAIEVYPSGTELFPDQGEGQANFRHNPVSSGFTATHATISVKLTIGEILDLAKKAGWRAIQLSRGPHDVIEFWIENRVMLEVMTKEMAEDYLKSVGGNRAILETL
ncbi:MAG: hypothetical protein J0I20_05140 [Chloroflexi bacterium]|nr:hypothetical protein [Chloroflexota bacterium]OJV97770.1 MAG: hypothetical protein BGO39_07565 [Chloroflexi bacterium 54-19]